MTKNPAAVALGRLGGKATSPAKSAAVAVNGKLGGRPKAPPTHYLHHQFLVEETGKHMQVWRLLPQKDNDHRSTASGDVRKYTRLSDWKFGELRKFPAITQALV